MFPFIKYWQLLKQDLEIQVFRESKYMSITFKINESYCVFILCIYCVYKNIFFMFFVCGFVWMLSRFMSIILL